MSGTGVTAPAGSKSPDFIRAMVAEDLRTGKYGGRVVTRFPPEPNGYLHIGHAKSICLNFGIALETGGVCHLRFDDTNPTTEDIRYTEAIRNDVRWLGFEWHDRLFYASDYFERLYEFAVSLIERGKAYVDSLSEDEIRAHRGTITEPGRDSPYRTRSKEENLDLFRRMRAGEFENGAHVLRAKIDMAAPNMLMRDPLLYRIRHAHHYRTGDAWCIYPMYDFAHCLSDAIERITHSLCTLEFKDNRDLYDWVLEAVGTDEPRPEQTEFARLDLEHTVLSKRKLVRLVSEGHVSGWDDPRLPTIAGLRRRGITPEAIRSFCDLIGVAKVDSRVDMGKLEFCVRDDLNQRSPRVMCVLRPLKIVIENYPEGETEELEAPYYPRDVPKEGSRRVPFSRELYIERDDFLEHPPKGFHRLAPGTEVRLRYAYVIKCVDVVKSSTGEILELRCTYDPETRGGNTPDGRKVKGTLHWVSAVHALPAEVRLYDRLFRVSDPDDIPAGHDFVDYLNPDSLVRLEGCRIEPSVAKDVPGSRYQFERLGYYCSDSAESRPGRLVYNRTVELRDTWAKLTARSEEQTERPSSRDPRETRRVATRRVTTRRAQEPRGPSQDMTVTFPTPRLEKRYHRYLTDLGLPDEDAVLLTRDQALSDFYDEAVAVHQNPRAVANWVVNEVLRELKGRQVNTLPFHGTDLGRLVALIDGGVISGRIAKDVFGQMVREGGDPERIVEAKGLRQITDDSALEALVGGVVDRFPDKAAAFQAGREGLLGFFVGQVMRESDGLANPERVESLLRARLRAGS